MIILLACLLVYYFYSSFLSFKRICRRYLDTRGLSNGVGPVIWPDLYGPAERDQVYKTFSLAGWVGRSGHDAPMIALDALLAAGDDWDDLMGRAAFHGGSRFKLASFNMRAPPIWTTPNTYTDMNC